MTDIGTFTEPKKQNGTLVFSADNVLLKNPVPQEKKQFLGSVLLF